MSCLTFGYDNRHVATRGGDDTLKLWDLRSFKKPVNVAKDLFSRFDFTQCSFSPDDKVCCLLTMTDGNLVWEKSLMHTYGGFCLNFVRNLTF